MGSHDVVVVGARCAGSPLAAQLARAGLSVVLVDKDSFPSDTPSTHFFQAEGLASLTRLGVMERLRATGAPLIGVSHGRVDDLTIEIPWPTRPGEQGGAMCVRRPVLDTILLEAAEDAGAEVHTGSRALGIVRDNGRVKGVRIATGDGEVELRAPLVVGADGRGSFVGRQVGARMYNLTPNERFGYWGYYESASITTPATAYLHRFGEDFLIGSPTDAGLFMIIVLPPLERLSSFRADPDLAFDAYLAKDPVLSDVVAGGRRVGPLYKMLRYTGYFRESAGPGWVLVGDAGHFKDPAPAQGISDALRQVDRLVPAIVGGLGGSGAGLDEALRDWWRWRDEDAFEQYWFAQDFGRAGPVPSLFTEIVRRLHQKGRSRDLVDIFNHRTRPSQVLTPGVALGAAGRLLRKGRASRRQALGELRENVSREFQHRRLNRRPAYREDVVEPEAEAVDA